MSEMLQVPAVAKILNVSEWTVSDLLKKGSLEGHKIGGTWRVTQTQIDAYLENTKNTRDTAADSER